MLDKLASLFSNGQVAVAVVALVDAIFGLLVATGSISHAPDAGLVASIVTISFTSAGIVLAYIQHSQHSVQLRYLNQASLISLQAHLANGGANPVSATFEKAAERAATAATSATA